MPKAKTKPAPVEPVKFVSANSFFDDMLGDIEPTEADREVYPHFLVRCALPYRRPPRHPFFEFVREMGSGHLDNILSHKPGTLRDTLTLVFPERHLNVSEQQQLFHRLNTHPDAKAGLIRCVDVVTTSPLIIGNMSRAQIRICRWPDDVDSWE